MIAAINEIKRRLSGIAVLAVFCQIPYELLRRGWDYAGLASGKITQKQQNQARACLAGHIRGLAHAFPLNPDGSLGDSIWYAGHNLIEEPGLSNSSEGDKSWLLLPGNENSLSDCLAWIRVQEQFGTLDFVPLHRPAMILFHRAQVGAASYLSTVLASALGPQIALWFTEDYPIERYRKEWGNDEFSSDLAHPESYYVSFADQVQAAFPNAEWGLVTQAYGYDPELFLQEGVPNAGYQYAAAQPTRLEDRHQVGHSIVVGNSRVIGRFAHNYNSHYRHSAIFGPNSQELAGIAAHLDYVAVPRTTWLVTNPVDPGNIPTITYHSIFVLRADGVTWAPLAALPPGGQPVSVTWSGPPWPTTPNEGSFTSASFPPFAGANPFGVLGLPDLTLRVSVSKNCTIVGARVQFVVNTLFGPATFEFGQSYYNNDPLWPGGTLPWDGLVDQHDLLFTLKNLRAGTQSAVPASLPDLLGPITGITLYAEALDPFWADRRKNFPTGPNPGNNYGVEYTLRKASAGATEAWLLMENNSPFFVPGGLIPPLTIALAAFGFLPTTAQEYRWGVPLVPLIPVNNAGDPIQFTLTPFRPYEVRHIRIT